MELLRISNLHVSFPTREGWTNVSNGVNLTLERGESLCLVGESGCGKTMLALSIIGLLPRQAHISGHITFKGKDLLVLKKKAIRKIRGREIAAIFEQPATCLNPCFTVGHQVAEAIRVHNNCSRKAAKAKAIELLRLVGLTPPEKRYGQYPHQFSGGMQQRVMIAGALASNPSLLIADEPTSFLDVTIQAQIIQLLQGLIKQFKTSLLLITHDLGLAGELCDTVAVMYAGEIVECGSVSEIFRNPKHPYTQALLGAISDGKLRPLNGSVPEMTNLPGGCRFHPRCSQAIDVCQVVSPQMSDGVRCHL